MFATKKLLPRSKVKIKLFFAIAMPTARLTTQAAIPNGARSNIAGICNRERNILGMMPHPERACEDLLGSSDGREIFRSLTNSIAASSE